MMLAPHGGKRLGGGGGCHCVHGCQTQPLTHKVVQVYELTLQIALTQCWNCFWWDRSKFSAQLQFCKFIPAPMSQ